MEIVGEEKGCRSGMSGKSAFLEFSTLENGSCAFAPRSADVRVKAWALEVSYCFSVWIELENVKVG